MDCRIIASACMVGIIGDALLQQIAPYLGGPSGWGLNSYFKQHGKFESMFIAGGMLSFFYVIYMYLFQFPITWLYVGLFGIVLDILFRFTRIFPSLDGYYHHVTYGWTAFWGFVPMVLVLGLFKIITTLKT